MAYYSGFGIRKHKISGKWQGYMYYYDSEGKRRQVSKISHQVLKRDAKTELQAWANELEATAKKKGFIEHSKKGVEDGPTVEAMITKLLEYQREIGQMEKSTFQMQMYYARTKIFPYIGDYLFVDLDTVAIESWVTELYKQGLSQNTIHTIFAIANKAYQHYYKRGQIPNNPFEFVESPHKSAAKVTHLSDEGTANLIAAMDEEFEQGDEMYCAIALALYAGLRRGEICALRWNDIDLKQGKLSVRSAIGVANGTYTKGPKNRSSIRSFPMIPQLLSIIEQRYQKVLSTFGSVQDSWFVVGDTIHYMAPTTLSRHFHEFVDDYGIVDAYGKPITLHALRHNYASVGIRAHMDIASLSLMMGHASRSMTLDTYGDANADALVVAADKLGDRFSLETDSGTKES